MTEADETFAVMAFISFLLCVGGIIGYAIGQDGTREAKAACAKSFGVETREFTICVRDKLYPVQP